MVWEAAGCGMGGAGGEASCGGGEADETVYALGRDLVGESGDKPTRRRCPPVGESGTVVLRFLSNQRETNIRGDGILASKVSRIFSRIEQRQRLVEGVGSVNIPYTYARWMRCKTLLRIHFCDPNEPDISIQIFDLPSRFSKEEIQRCWKLPLSASQKSGTAANSSMTVQRLRPMWWR